jgi:hypothetical protein
MWWVERYLSENIFLPRRRIAGMKIDVPATFHRGELLVGGKSGNLSDKMILTRQRICQAKLVGNRTTSIIRDDYYVLLYVRVKNNIQDGACCNCIIKRLQLRQSARAIFLPE